MGCRWGSGVYLGLKDYIAAEFEVVLAPDSSYQVLLHHAGLSFKQPAARDQQRRKADLYRAGEARKRRRFFKGSGSIAVGYSCNGRTAWRWTGGTYGDWENRDLDPTVTVAADSLHP